MRAVRYSRAAPTFTALAVTLALTLTIAPIARGAADPDPFYGTWQLDRDQSHYAHESPPDRMTVVIEPEPDGLAYRSEAQYAGGRTLALHYTAHFDGVPALVVGSAGFLAPIALSRVDATTIEAVYRMHLQKVAWSHWSLNAERTRLVVTTTSLTVQGEEIRNVAVFRRED
jgi:hypothetical protein